uniref:pirin-like n=1 Tax=Styela clava TaxID=7725 RepID=UPI0019396063|nr:pirin-like [Styela clava]
MTGIRTVKEVRLIEEFVNGNESGRCIIGDKNVTYLDPFLLFEDSKMSPPAGYPDHPHRGFEVLFYIIGGKVRHENFSGCDSILEQGDMLFISAGKGVMHSELPVGESHEVQLWVNMKNNDKMCDMAYHEVLKSDIPTKTKEGITAKVLLGEALGTKSEVKTRTPVSFVDFFLEPNTAYNQTVPENWTCLVYVLEGCIDVSDTKVLQYHCAFLSEGSSVTFRNDSGCNSRFIFVSGQPVNEPVHRNEQFVMNTKEQLDQAMMEFKEFKNGFEKGKTWKGSSKR